MKQLRFTTTRAYSLLGAIFAPDAPQPELLVIPDIDEEGLIQDTVKGTRAYIHNDAEELAGFDIPTFLDGNLGQLDLPIEEQDILMMLLSGNYQCKAELQLDEERIDRNAYYITLKTEM